MRRDDEQCRAMIRAGSRSFYAASMLLPARVRKPAFALYSFCRLADDAVDDGADPGRAVAQLNARLEAAYAGRPVDFPADRAFARVIEGFELPRALPEALLEGFAWDAENRRYRDLAGVRAYSARVAGAVGAMMCVLMGAREDETLARACDLGVAMQLTNIARDVGEDARRGRIYLPLDWLEEAGLEPNALAGLQQAPDGLRELVVRLLDQAERLYARADAGVSHLPPDCRAAILAARMIYAEIGREIARAEYDSLTRRAVVSTSRKLSLLAQAHLRAFSLRPEAPRPALPETRFLVAATAQTAPARAAENSGFGSVIDIWARLEARDRMHREPTPAERV